MQRAHDGPRAGTTRATFERGGRSPDPTAIRADTAMTRAISLRESRKRILTAARSTRTICAMRERDRRLRLLDQLRADGHTSVAELSRSLGVTPSTIRRHLQRLARDC